MKIAINGLGRIGRAALKHIIQGNLDIVAINDLADINNLAYLLQYDSVYGRWSKEIKVQDKELVIGKKKIVTLSEADPQKLPWKDLGVEVVLECTGVFTSQDKAQAHIKAGAKKVIISAPAKDETTPTKIVGVSDSKIKAEIVSNASCTTNCLAPILEILSRGFGLEKSLMTTIHAYTATQNLVDGPNKKWSRGRSAALNIVPTTTGAAKATAKALPVIKDISDGIAIRVPVPAGSLSDVTALLTKNVTKKEVNELFQAEAKSDRYKGIVGYTDRPLVSSDFIGDEHSAVVAGDFTRVVGGNFIKVLAWYDNEWAYSKRLVELISYLA